MKTIAQLKSEGFEVRITHLRQVNDSINALIPAHLARKLSLSVEPRGGMTIAEIKSATGLKYLGFSRVHPIDNFNRKLGVRIALERAYTYFLSDGEREVGQTIS